MKPRQYRVNDGEQLRAADGTLLESGTVVELDADMARHHASRVTLVPDQAVQAAPEPTQATQAD